MNIVLEVVCAIYVSDSTNMVGMRDLGIEDKAHPITFLPFFLGPMHAKGPWDPAGATFKYILDHNVSFVT